MTGASRATPTLSTLKCTFERAGYSDCMIRQMLDPCSQCTRGCKKFDLRAAAANRMLSKCTARPGSF
jgi:hypothetical protein